MSRRKRMSRRLRPTSRKRALEQSTSRKLALMMQINTGIDALLQRLIKEHPFTPKNCGNQDVPLLPGHSHIRRVWMDNHESEHPGAER